MKTNARCAPILVTFFVFAWANAHAQILPQFLQGNVEVIALQAEVAGEKRDTLSQQYNVSMVRQMGANMRFRAAARYFKFDLDTPELNGALREELQPSAELFWKHPHFLFTSSAFRRDLRLLSADESLITDDLQFGLRSRDPELPALELRYGWQRIEDQAALSGRDSRDWRLQASVKEEFDWQALRYAFTHHVSTNRITDLQVTQDSHLFGWNAARTPLDTDRVQFLANYRFHQLRQRDQVLGGSGGVLDALSGLGGLYARNASPAFGQLERADGLTDNLRDIRTDPRIDIGGANQDQNVGIDLGFERVTSTIYVYVDRISGDGVLWTAYSSDDNLNWDRLASTGLQSFNAGLRRYELSYAETSARYVKVVSSGTNEVTEAFVSEIEIFGPVPEDAGSQRNRSSHVGDFRTSYEVSDRWDTSVDASYRYEPAQGNESQRQSVNYAARADFDQSATMSHHLRLEEAIQSFDAQRPTIRDDVVAYSLMITPLSTIAFNASASSRFEKVADRRSRELHSALIEARGDIRRALTLSNALSTSRALLFDRNSRSDSWTYRVGAQGAVHRSLDASLGWVHQETSSRGMNGLRVRSTATFGFNLRVSQTIFMRGDFNRIDDSGVNSNQDYLLSWRLTPNLNFSAQTVLNDFGEGLQTRQYGLNLNYKMNSRSVFFFRYASVDYSEAGGTTTDSFQQGFRTSL